MSAREATAAGQAEAALAQLSRTATTEGEDEEEERICAFTLEPPVDPVRTLCGHVFERSALAQYRASSLPNSSTCPLCRRPILKEAPAFEPYGTLWCIAMAPYSHSNFYSRARRCSA
ncbi:hypothetical protein T492DRAFT_971028 [Pavlovales sp. CCMP2436]|nr:hypothetical protein T492DRAFT_971028 [Pavlovales sp. CCMP2436]